MISKNPTSHSKDFSNKGFQLFTADYYHTLIMTIKTILIALIVLMPSLHLKAQIDDKAQGKWILKMAIGANDTLRPPFDSLNSREYDHEIYFEVKPYRIEYEDGCNLCYSKENSVMSNGIINGMDGACTKVACPPTKLQAAIDYNGSYEFKNDQLVIRNNTYTFVFDRIQ